MESFIKDQFAAKGVQEPDMGELYAHAMHLTAQSLILLRGIGEQLPSMISTADRIQKHKPLAGNKPSAAEILSLLEDLEKLCMDLTICLGREQVVPALKNLALPNGQPPPFETDPHFSTKVETLSRAMDSFRGDYPRLLNHWNVIKDDLIGRGFTEDSLFLFNGVEMILKLREQASHIKWQCTT
jgi:hypothetical protein